MNELPEKSENIHSGLSQFNEENVLKSSKEKPTTEVGNEIKLNSQQQSPFQNKIEFWRPEKTSVTPNINNLPFYQKDDQNSTQVEIPAKSKILSKLQLSPRSHSPTIGNRLQVEKSTLQVQRSETSIISKPISSLFPENFKYLEVFKAYRKKILDFVIGCNGKQKNPDIFFSELFLHPQNIIEKAILLEAIEYIKIKLSSIDESIEKLDKRILIIKSSIEIGKKSKPLDIKVINLIIDYQQYLREELNNCQNQISRNELQQESDLCLILWTATKLQTAQGKSWDKNAKKTFIKNLIEHTVYEQTNIALYDPTLAIRAQLKNDSLKECWQRIYRCIQNRLPLQELEVLKQEIKITSQAQKKRYEQLCQAFKNHLSIKTHQGWKKQWLYGHDMLVCRFGGKSGITVNGFFHLSQTITPERFVIDEESLPGISGLLGSTYFSADKPFSSEKTLCLDTNYQSGTAGATSDGYGHFMTEKENCAVQQAAYRIVKLAVRYANFYTDAETFYQDLPQLLHHIGQAVKQSFLHPEEAGTASCALTKAFIQQNEKNEKGEGNENSKGNKKIVVSGGVGDGMVIAWDPCLNKLTVLLNPRQYDRGFQFTPISITETLKGQMIQRNVTILPSEAFLIRMTDGAWQLLPNRSVKLFDVDANKHYMEYTLDVNILEEKLQIFALQNPDAKARNYREFLQSIMQVALEDQKSLLLEYQHSTKQKLKQFGEEKNHGNSAPNEKNENNKSNNVKTFSDFIAWAENTDKDFHNLLLMGLQILGFTPEVLQDMPLFDFSKTLEKINIGDDITLHVESLANAENINEQKQIIGSNMF